MARPLTHAAVLKLKPGADRREVADGGCPGLHLIIQPISGSKSWAVRFRRPNGKPAKLTLGTCDTTGKEANGEPVIGGHLTLAAARRLATEVRRKIALGQDPAADYLAERHRRRAVADELAANTFGACTRQFVDEYTVPKKGRKPRHWRENARYLGLDYPAGGGEPVEIAGGLAQRWGDKPINEIDSHDVHGVIDEARRRGIPGLQQKNEGISDARGRKMCDALGTMFGWFSNHRRITTDPTVSAWRPPAPEARARVLNCKTDVRRADELRWIWAACDAVGEPFGSVLRLLLLTGCRLREVAEMRRDEVADDMSMLRLPGSRTKNGRPHDVPLPPLARDILAGVRRIENCEYVFSTNGRTPVSGFSKIKQRLDGAMLVEAQKERGKDATIDPWRLHDLRRTCATGMAGIGVQPHIIEACLNHVSGAKAAVAGVYNVETYEPEKRAALERWAAHVEGLVSGKAATVTPLRPRAS
jgi:hypothetical protein